MRVPAVLSPSTFSNVVFRLYWSYLYLHIYFSKHLDIRHIFLDQVWLFNLWKNLKIWKKHSSQFQDTHKHLLNSSISHLKNQLILVQEKWKLTRIDFQVPNGKPAAQHERDNTCQCDFHAEFSRRAVAICA